MKPNVHIVSYTHWDREFRWEFEHTRVKMVDCIDNLLDIMTKNKDFKSFLMDGQVGMIDDYLEIRPEKEPVIRKLAAEGRLELGPWYSLPDCATLNGECVIRNLQLGVKVSKEFGGTLNCGYNVFSFGQIAQLPQIYGNFGIDIIIFYKYMNPKRSILPEFIWEAPDGTKAYASRLGREARWNYFFAGHIPIVYDRDPWDKNWRYDYGTLGKVFHTADAAGYPWFHEILDPETSYHKKNLEMGFERSLATVEGTAAPESLLFFDGTDFTEPHPKTPAIIKDLQEKFSRKFNIMHSSLGAYLEELKGILKKRKNQLQTISGPMRDGPVGGVHSDVFTIHPEIKLQNSRTENTLIRYAEPLSALAWSQGIDSYPKTYFDKAWKLLFQSHAHDSVHGLGPFELGEGVVSRMKQSGLIAQAIERKSLGNITKEIKTSDIKDSSTFLAVHNTASFPRSEVVEAWVDIPAEIALDKVIIEDMKGKPCAIQEIRREVTRAGIYHPRSRNMPYYSTRVQLLFWAEKIPALGYKTFKLKWTAKKEYPYPHEDWDPPVVITDDLLVSPRKAQNPHISLKINDDGTFDVTDLASGKVYQGLNSILESGDIGNMWMYNEPPGDELISSRGSVADIACIKHGSLSVSFKIKNELSVPAFYDFHNRKRSAERTVITAVTEVTLNKGSRYVEVKTTIDNTAKDHYIKVCFPSGLKAKTTTADCSLAVTDYSTNPDLTCELARHPAQLWYTVNDGKNGLSVLPGSVKDYEIINDDGTNTFAMGLLRGVQLRIACDNRLWMEYPGDESSQSIGKSTHKYAIMPHQEDWIGAKLYQESLAFNQPLKACQFGRQKGTLPTENSFVEIKNPNLVLSAVKKAEDRNSLLVRFFNPTGKDIDADINVGFDFKTAYMVKLSEAREKELKTAKKGLKVKAGKGAIVTIEFAL